MPKLVRVSIVIIATILMIQTQVAASAGRGNGGAPKAKAASAKPVKVSASKPTKTSKPVKAPTTSGKAAKSATPLPAKNAKSAKTTTSPVKSEVATKSAKKSPSKTNSTVTTEPIGPEMNSKLQKKLGEDSKHAARLGAKLNLPEGITIQQAGAGFKNWGQFNAAVNLSNRLGIPFNDLKAALTGWTLPNVHTGDATKTTTGTMSLGQAQQAYKAGTLPTYPSPETVPTVTSISVTTRARNSVSTK